MACQPLSRDDITSYILAGLGHEYNIFVSSIYAQSDQVALEEVYSLLIVTKSRLNPKHHFVPALLAEAHFVQRQPFTNFRNRNNYHSRGRNNKFRGRGNYSNNRMDTSNSNSLVCQVCGKHGHSARKYYHCFDLTYQNSSTAQNK